MSAAAAADLRSEQEMFLEVVEEMARGRVAPAAEQVDERGRLDADVLGLLRENQVQTAGLAEDRGGAGADPLLGLLVLERLAAASAALAVPTLTAHGCGYALEHGNDESGPVDLSAEVAPLLVIGGSFKLERPAGGAVGLEGAHSAVVCPGGSSEALLVVADDEQSGEQCLVALATDRAELGDASARTGLRGIEVRPLTVDVELDPGAVVGGAAAAQAARSWWLLGWGAIATGIARAALAQTAEYLLERRQFGQPLAEFAALQEIVARCQRQVGAAAAQLQATARRADALATSAAAECAAAARSATEAAVATTIDAIQLHGGYGYVREYPVERFMRDAVSARARVAA
ncbi:MAG TPA: acyl-CoA dehydrogenase family protein [Solirubrobacterales bacterium]|nr:acyl-CoA dehydrogenase family protein [Solirubrobacterales bacterium]